MPKRNALLRWLIDPEPPGLGLDLRSTEVAIARMSEKRGKPELDLCVTAPLAEGVIEFSMLEPNIKDRESLTRSLENLFLKAGVSGKRIALTLPDYLTRCSMVELPESPRSRQDTLELLKFRLKKTLPFDVEQARIAFERAPGKVPLYWTGVMHEAVVSQYEDFLAELGFRAGLVLPTSASLLNLLRPLAEAELAPGAEYFFVNAEREYFTVNLVQDGMTPALTRTLGLRASEGQAVIYREEDLLQEIIPTVIYYREKLQKGSLERIYYRCLRPDLTGLHAILEEQFEAQTEPFDLGRAMSFGSNLNMDPPLADAVSAAAGAAAGHAA